MIMQDVEECSAFFYNVNSMCVYVVLLLQNVEMLLLS